jgi:hypothetical protein
VHGVCTDAMGYAMDGLQALDLALFAAGAFAAAFVTGIAGFAFGVVAAAVWLHVLTSLSFPNSLSPAQEPIAEMLPFRE